MDFDFDMQLDHVFYLATNKHLKYETTHNRGTQGKPGIGVKPEINPGSGCE